MARSVRPLVRRLTFYKWEGIGSEPLTDWPAAAKALRSLPDDVDRPIPYGDNTVDVTVDANGDKDHPTRLTVMRLRSYEERPYVRAPGGPMRPITMRPEERILDATHVAVWSDGYAACDQGGYAPTPTSLALFLQLRIHRAVVFKDLFDRQLVQRLHRLQGITGFAFRVSHADAVQRELDAATLGPIRGLFQHLQGGTEQVIFEGNVHVSGRGRGAHQRILESVSPGEVIALVGQAERFYDTFKVRGRSAGGRVEEIDLVRERLQIEQRLPRAPEGGHLPDPNATFTALIAARSQLDREQRLVQAVISDVLATPP